MPEIIFSVLLPGIIIASILAYALLPRWIVITGPDKPTYKDVPELNRYMNIAVFTYLILTFAAIVLNLPHPQIEMVICGLIVALGIAVALLEKKYLPGTRRYWVTLCWVAGVCIVFAIYGWVALISE